MTRFNVFKIYFDINGKNYIWSKFDVGYFKYMDDDKEIAFTVKRDGLMKPVYFVEVNDDFDAELAIIITLLLDYGLRGNQIKNKKKK